MTATVLVGPGIADVSNAPRAFPSVPYESAAEFGAAYFDEWAQAVASLDPMALDRAAGVLLSAYLEGSVIFSCGNGGSAAIADHLQCDHLKGVRTGTDLLPRVASLASNVDLITAIANDIGYDDVFSYQLQSQSRPGDVLVAISSSGDSPNILRALLWARAHGMKSIALTGFSGGGARHVADVSIHVTCWNYGIVEDLHQAVMHSLAQ
ncbi:MAG: D-sedoheptulose-7-phosphate isomerase, partial [Nitrososphaerales archaeon]